MPEANRNRAAERAIAALEWSCEHCDEATTRGAKVAHLAACPQLPTACAAAAAGCGWAGMMSEQAAHEAACPFAVCQRMMAPLQAECQELRACVMPLQAQNQQLQARLLALEPLQARCDGLKTCCDGLQAQNEQLRRQVAALPPLAGRVRALEGDGEEGRRRQWQRLGPAPHDAPPSDAALASMGLAAVVAPLRAHVAVVRVAETACTRLAHLFVTKGSEQAAVGGERAGAGLVQGAGHRVLRQGRSEAGSGSAGGGGGGDRGSGGGAAGGDLTVIRLLDAKQGVR